MPRRSRNLDAAPLHNRDNVLYAQLRKQSPREKPRSQPIFQDKRQAFKNTSTVPSLSGPSTDYPEISLLESKSRSLPLLDDNSDREQSYRLSAPPHTPPRLSPKPARQAGSYSPQERTDVCSRPRSCHSPELESDSCVYHLAGRPCSPHTAVSELRSPTSEQRIESVYAEVTENALLCQNPHCNTYKLIPVNKSSVQPKPSSNTYEPLEDIRTKNNHSSWGLKVSHVTKVIL